MCFRSKQFILQILIFKNLEKIKVFDKSSIFVISLGRIRIQDLQLISLDSYPLDHGSMIENCGFFGIYIFLVNKQLVDLKKLFRPETHLVFTNVGSEILCYRVMAFSFSKFWSWAPCRRLKFNKLTKFTAPKIAKNGKFCTSYLFHGCEYLWQIPWPTLAKILSCNDRNTRPSFWIVLPGHTDNVVLDYNSAFELGPL